MRTNQLERAIHNLEEQLAAISRAIEVLKIQRTAQATMTRVPRLVDRRPS